MDSEEQKINAAIDEATRALTENYLQIGESEITEKRIEELASKIWQGIITAPEQYEHSDWRGKVSLSAESLAALLHAIHSYRLEVLHLSTYEAQEEKMAEIISAAWKVFSDKRETDRNKYNQAVLNVLGFKQRPANIDYRVVSEEFDQMNNGVRGSKTAAYRFLADKYGVGVDAIRKGIKRHSDCNP